MQEAAVPEDLPTGKLMSTLTMPVMEDMAVKVGTVAMAVTVETAVTVEAPSKTNGEIPEELVTAAMQEPVVTLFKP